MSKFCQHCGNELAEKDTFCQRCGTNCNSTSTGATAAPVAPVAQTAYSQNNYQQPQQEMVPEMTTGQWVGTILLCTLFGIISIILCIVWGFANNNIKSSKKNFCRAMLIVNIITFVFTVIMLTIIFAAIAASGYDFENFIRELTR